MVDLLDQTLYEGRLSVGDETIVRWTNSGNYYSAKAKILKINNKSVRVELTEQIKSEMGHYPIGNEIIVPRSSDFRKWSENNGVFAPTAPKSQPKITVKIGNTEKVYELFKCNAPAQYDYDYVLTLTSYNDERTIAIPTERSHYQRARYASGLYHAEPLEMNLVTRAEEMLWERLHQKLSD